MDRLKLNANTYRQAQGGFVLLTALAFMIVLTVIVLSTVNISSSDEKIARSSRDKDVAFAAADAARRDAELYISGSFQFPYLPVNHLPPLDASVAAYFTTACNMALCDFRAVTLAVPIDQLDFINGDTQDTLNGVPIAKASNLTSGNCPSNNTLHGTVGPMQIGCATGSPSFNLGALPPRYLIEVVPNANSTVCNGSAYAFRITAQGVGRLLTPQTRVTLQEFYCP